MWIRGLIIVLCLCASSLCAQTPRIIYTVSMPVSGSVTDEAEFWYIIDIDFGASPSSSTIDVSIGATGGTSGLDVTLVDLDAAAASGTLAGAADGNSDAGTGTIILSISSASYSGVRQFALIVGTDSGSGMSPFTGTVLATAPNSGAMTLNDSGAVPFVVNQIRNLFGRLTRCYQGTSAAGSVQQEFTVDFGATPQSVTFTTQLQSLNADASVDIFEIDSTGTPQLRGTANATAGTIAEASESTSTRSGPVTFRLVLNAAAAGQFGIHTIWPGSTTITSPSPVGVGGPGDDGDGGGDKGGCSTGGASGWLMLLALAALLGVAVRTRRA